jgi:Ca2+-binding EF-hand superfamily protein
MGSVTSKSSMSQSDLSYLLENTKYDQATVQAWYKIFSKTSSRGRLNVQQFVHIFNSFFPGRSSYQFCEHVFRTFNTSKSGELSFKEFLIAVHVTAQGSREEKFRWTFRLYDVNADGILTREEVSEVLEASKDLRESAHHYTHKPQLTAEELFMNIDRKGLGALTEEQFVVNCLLLHGEEV